MRLLLIIGMLLAFGATVLAQGGGRTIGAPSSPTINPMTERLGEDQAPYSRSLVGTILSVDAASGSVVIENSRKARMEFTVDKKSRMRADRNTDLAGRTSLSLVDYKPGNPVKLIYRVSDHKVLEVRLRRPEN